MRPTCGDMHVTIGIHHLITLLAMACQQGWLLLAAYIVVNARRALDRV